MGKVTTFSVVAALLLLEYLIQYTAGVSVEEDLTLSLKEKMALDKFKVRMLSQLPHAYMKQDIYLIRWLRAKKLNLDEAERMLKENLRWRKLTKMDTIHSEDWSDMEEEFPLRIDTQDKELRPIWSLNIGQWNHRRAVLAGKGPRLLRWLDKMMDNATMQIIRHQELGHNVTQWTALMNFDGFSVPINACPLCLPLYATFTSSYENHFPGYADNIILINTPPTFEIVLNIVRPIFAPPTSKALKIFGPNKGLWGPFLDKIISKEERRVEFLGTKID